MSNQAKRYRAFLSYKHEKSTQFAINLELALKNYAKPIWRPPMAIFRDEKYLVPGKPLSDLIVEALNDSEHLIYLASPAAAGSIWVQDEIERWTRDSANLETLIIVLTKGTIAFDSETKNIDWSRTDALPHTLRDRLIKLPLYVDATHFTSSDTQTLQNSEFRQAVNQIVAKLRGIDPIEMSGKEVLQHRRNILIRNGTFAAAGFAAIIAGISYWSSVLQERAAKASEAAGSAQSIMRSDVPDSRRAIQLALQALDLSPGLLLARDVLQDVSRELPRHVWTKYQRVPDNESAPPQRLSRSTESGHLFVWERYGSGKTVSAGDGLPLSEIAYPHLKGIGTRTDNVRYDSHGTALALRAGAELHVTDLATGDIMVKLPYPEHLGKNWAMNTRGGYLVRENVEGQIVLVSFNDPSSTRSVPIPHNYQLPCQCRHAFNAAGSLLAVAIREPHQQLTQTAPSYAVFIYSTADLERVREIRGIEGQVQSMRFSDGGPDPLLAVQVFHDATGRPAVEIHNTRISQTPRKVRLDSNADVMRFADENRILVLGHTNFTSPTRKESQGNQPTVVFYATNNGRRIGTIPFDTYTIGDVVVADDTKHIYIAGSLESRSGYYTYVAAWDLSAMDNYFGLRMADRPDGPAMAFHPSEPLLAIERTRFGHDPDTIDIVDRQTGEVLQRLNPDPTGEFGFVGSKGLHFTPDGKRLAMLAWGEDLVIWNTGTWQQTHQVSRPPKELWKTSEPPLLTLPVELASFAPTLAVLRANALGGNKTDLAVAGGLRAKQVRTKNTNASSDADERRRDCKIVIDDWNSKGVVAHLNLETIEGGHCTQIDATALRADGNAIAIGVTGYDGSGTLPVQELQIWQPRPWYRRWRCLLYSIDCRWRRTVTIPLEYQAHSILYSSSGRYLAVRDGSGRITLYDGFTHGIERIFLGRAGRGAPSAPSIVFSTDERWLATSYGSLGGPMRWRIDDDQLISDIRNRIQVLAPNDGATSAE